MMNEIVACHRKSSLASKYFFAYICSLTYVCFWKANWQILWVTQLSRHLLSATQKKSPSIGRQRRWMFALSVSPFLNRVNIDCTYDRTVVTEVMLKIKRFRRLHRFTNKPLSLKACKLWTQASRESRESPRERAARLRGPAPSSRVFFRFLRAIRIRTRLPPDAEFAYRLVTVNTKLSINNSNNNPVSYFALPTVNPLLSPPRGLFISSSFEGGVIGTGAYLRRGAYLC